MGSSTSKRTWSAYESTVCHYCGEKADTVDHIVPRAALPKPLSRLPYWFRAHDEVPACKSCNGKKADSPSDCVCDTCNWAWKTAMAMFVIDGYEKPPVCYLVRSPG